MRQPVISVPEPGSATPNSSATRYGVMMGGPSRIEWNLIGEMAIGHQQIDRRDLTMFTNIDVGRRNESEAALNDDRPSLHMEWYKNPDRIITKTALDCSKDVKSTYGEIFGFVVPEILIGLSPERANELFEGVLPVEIVQQPLVEVVKHLSSSTHKDLQSERLRQDLLSGATTCFENLMKYVTALKTEAGIARDKGTGKKGPDLVEVEYFRELNVPLPEEVPAIATLAMGKEIAASLSGGGNNQVLEAILKQNQLLIESIKESRQAPAQELTAEPVATKVAAEQKRDK